MDARTFLGALMFVYGVAMLYITLFAPHRSTKLALMKKRMGDKRGFAFYAFSYGVFPTGLGAYLLIRSFV